MIVLGADTHKRSHMVAAVAAGTGELLGEADRPGWAPRFRRVVAMGALTRRGPRVGA